MTNKKRLAVLTGGGDTPLLNSVIFSLKKLLEDSKYQYIGFLQGWDGVLKKEYIYLNTVGNFSDIGGTFLKSSRVNLANSEDGFLKANNNLSDLSVEYLIIIGGDDTLSNAYGIKSTTCICVSKTIDNDVGSIEVKNNIIKIENYFTLGYPTAANQIARFASLQEGLRTTAYSHERIVILESMGMHAGWLTMASAAGKPNFIIIPEFPLDYNNFLEKLKQQYSKYRNSIIVIAEGTRYLDGSYIKQDYNEVDDFGHARFGGSSFILRDRLKNDLKGFMNVRNINAVNPAYLYRSGKPHFLEKKAAALVSKLAFELIQDQKIREHQFISIEYNGSDFAAKTQPLNLFPQTSEGRFPKRYINEKFYNADTFSATEEWFDYLDPIVDFKLRDVSYY